MEDKVEKIQKLAKEKGHCLCSPVFTCECEYFKRFNKCHCAGDEVDLAEWTTINSENDVR